ncbi:MAG TPA: hypothetical protein VLZ05_08125 [Mycobacterium sp.]|nr:hypothetical protein [Mycobacterium sp.]HUH68847.1 hypothetical protein [Mycobacterium sp.]
MNKNKSKENIEWMLLEPRNENGEASGIGTWGGHVYTIVVLQAGTCVATHQFRGGEITVLVTGVDGHRAWRTVRDHCTAMQHAA